MPRAKRIRILLADDHPIVRDGLKRLIGAHRDLEVVGEAANGRQAIEHAARLRPDVVVMDLTMPDMSGLEATNLLTRTQPGSKVLVLSVHEDVSYFQQLIGAGARGYLLKRAAADELVRALRAVAAGNVYWDPGLAEQHLSNRPGTLPPARKGRTIQPSPREEKVLRLVAWGYTHKEIADQLRISTKTVETYRARLCDKLSLRGRTDIVRYALRQGWLKEP